MKKVILLTLLTLVFLLQCIGVCGVEEFKYDGVKYTCIGHKLIVAGVDPSIKTLNIKKNLNIGGTEYFVGSIKSGALSESNVEEMSLPEEGIDINVGAFRNAAKLYSVKNLNKANIISSDYMFMGCCSLRNVDLPASLELIGSSMFCGCTSLESITINKNVLEIDADSFLGCINLNKVNIEEGSKLKNIEKGAFAGCKNLECFNISKDIDKIAEYAFFGCEKLSNNCKIVKNVINYDRDLEEKSKKAELFARKILESEAQNGRNLGELVDAKDIDRLLYKYTPKSTDKPTVVSKEEFDKITSDGRLVLYRGMFLALVNMGEK